MSVRWRTNGRDFIFVSVGAVANGGGPSFWLAWISRNAALKRNPTHAMTPTEIDAENLTRTFRHDRRLPRILHRAVAWAASTRLGSRKLRTGSTAVRPGIGRQAPLPAPPADMNPGDPMPMHLLSRLCCARLPLTIDDQAEIQMCDVLRSAGLIEAELPPMMHRRGRAVYSGHATVMRVTPKGHAASELVP